MRSFRADSRCGLVLRQDTMQTLRDTVERLEAKYVQAVKEKATLAAADSTDAQRALRFPYMTWYTQSSAATLGNNFTTGASSKYSELISATSRLKEENFRLKQTIHEKHKLKETLERFFSDFVETAPASPEALVRQCPWSLPCAKRVHNDV